jgi:LysR family transcriptional regulator, regulator for genes of the gallate degradation pathway
MTPSQQNEALLSNLQYFRTFEVVASANSITRASEQLLKAPSAVARSIAELESALGATLFERSSRGVSLNAHGVAVMGRALRISDEIRCAVDGFFASSKNRLTSRNSMSNALFSGRKLLLLINIAEVRSISAVAARMKLSQGGVSLALSRLEDALGQSLFERRDVGLVATEATQKLLIHGSRILAEVRHLLADLATLSGEPTGLVMVGTTHLGRAHFFPAAIAAAVTKISGIRICSIENSYEVLIDRLRRGDIDIMFGALRPEPAGRGVIAHPLVTDHLSVIANARHPLAQRQDLSMADLITEKWILPRSNDFGKAQVNEYFRSAGLEPPLASIETGDLATVREVLWVSNMLSLISPHQMTLEIKSGLLTELPVSACGKAIQVGYLVREGARVGNVTS